MQGKPTDIEMLKALLEARIVYPSGMKEAPGNEVMVRVRYIQEAIAALARLATYEAALREIANIPEGDDYVDSDRDLMLRLNDARALARKALEDNT